MAASAMTPKLLNRISNEKYQEKDKWKIDDIALGPANELLISGHNLEIPTTFISMYKEVSGKYENRPEFNRSFRQPQPGEQLVLFLEGSSIIGLKVESALRLVSIRDMGILKTLNWKRSPTCVCFYRGKLYAASSSTNIVSVCNLEEQKSVISEEKSDVVLSEMRSDCVLDMVVVMEEIYVCTKVAGRALVFSMTGSKKLEFEYAFESDAKATSICIHEKTELVFVLWNNIQIQLYSQRTSQCIRALYMTEKLHKIRVTTENILVTLSAPKCIVSVYDVGEVIEIDEFEKTILSPVKKKHREKSMSHDEENLKDHPANSETNTSIYFSSKSASKQSKAEKLPNTKELYMKQLEENENLRRESDRDVQKLQERMKKLDEEKGKVEKEKKILRHEKKELQKEKDATLRQKQQIRREMEDEKTKREINKQVFIKVLASQEEENLKLQKEKEYLIERLSTRESEAISQEMLSRFLSDAEPDNVSCQSDTTINGTDELESVIAESAHTGEMLSRFLSDAEPDNVSCQSDTTINGTDELHSDIAESADSGIYSSCSTNKSYFSNLRVANGEQLNPDLKVAVTLTVKGAHMHIPDTGVELDIPTGAVRHKQLIELTIIPFDKQFAPIKNFSSNSSVVVELLPNKARFSLPVYLKLPHCLQLKGSYKDNKNPVKVFVSHHEAGPPVWKEDSSAKCTLGEDHCVIRLKHFCWVKYEINDKIVVAKRLKVFTAGKSIHANDSIAEIEVGYYMDLPGRAENMIATLGMEFYQHKPFVFVKEGELSLQLVLSKTVPQEWTYITPNDNPKTISYKSIADDKDTSCPFALENSSPSERKPFCIFKIVQGNESVELSMRF